MDIDELLGFLNERVLLYFASMEHLNVDTKPLEILEVWKLDIVSEPVFLLVGVGSSEKVVLLVEKDLSELETELEFMEHQVGGEEDLGPGGVLARELSG